MNGTFNILAATEASFYVDYYTPPMRSSLLSEYPNNTKRCNRRLRRIDHIHFMPRLKQESIGDDRVSIIIPTSVLSTDHSDRVIVQTEYWIN